MKKTVFCIVTMFVFGCDINTKNQMPDLPGAYHMFSNTISNGITDSVASDMNQSKIYTENHFIYAATHDSIASFAVGTYSKEGTRLTEQVLFSASDTSIFQPANYLFDIKKTPQGYSQILKNTGTLQGKLPETVENYKHIGNKAKCPMDGAWKVWQSYLVHNKDTTWDKAFPNFKLCYDGYIIWGAVSLNPSIMKHQTYMGVSSFTMEGNKGKELCINSNYYQNKGKTFNMDIEFRNSNEFKQTIVDSLSGIRYVEIFQRLNRQ